MPCEVCSFFKELVLFSVITAVAASLHVMMHIKTNLVAYYKPL